MFLGVTLSCNTLCHYVQALVVERLLEAAGPRRAEREAELRGWCREGAWPDFSFAGMEAVFRCRSLIAYGRIGPATVRSVRAAPMVAAALDELDHNRRLLPGDFQAWAARCRQR